MSAVSPCPRGPGGNSAAFSLGWGDSAIFRSCGSTLVSEPLDVWAGSSTCGQGAADSSFSSLHVSPTPGAAAAAASTAAAHLVDASGGEHDGGQRQQTVSLQQQAAQGGLAARQQHLSAGQTGLEEQPGVCNHSTGTQTANES